MNLTKAEISCCGHFKKIETHYSKCKTTIYKTNLRLGNKSEAHIASRYGIKKLPLGVLSTFSNTTTYFKERKCDFKKDNVKCQNSSKIVIHFIK